MILNRLASAKSFGQDKHNLLTINYNTTIVDLNPFKKENFHPEEFHPDSSNHSRTSSGNENTPKILPQRKYLINKNLRFYEPIKDAEIIAQMHLLRSKLHTDKIIEYAAIGKAKSHRETNINKRQPTPPPQQPPHSAVSTTNQSNNNKQNLVAEPTNTTISSTVASSTSTANASIKSKDTDERISEIKVIAKTISPQSHKSYVNGLFLEKSDSERVLREIEEDLADLEEVKDFDEETDFPGLKKFAQNYRRKKLNVSQNHSQTSLHQNKSKESLKLQTTSHSNLPDINTALLHTNFNYVLRKSRKFRLNNIYKPTEHAHTECSKSKLFEEVNKKPNTANSNLITALNLSTSTFIPESQDKQKGRKSGSFNGKKLVKDVRRDSVYCQDPNCEYKYLVSSNVSSVQSKKEFPNERYQRMKNDEFRVIQNIISDIPNTLTTMSNIGKVTNVERLLANKLTDFYTQKTRYIK